MKIRNALLCVVAATAIGGNASAYTINGGAIDVGGLDSLIGKTTLANQNPSVVLSWVNGLVNPDFTESVRTNAPAYTVVDGTTNIFAFALGGAADYFTVNKKQNHTALFKNESNLAWGVFSLADLAGYDFNIKSGQSGALSHSDRFYNKPTTSVPEPGSLGLLAAGILGLAYGRRRLSA